MLHNLQLYSERYTPGERLKRALGLCDGSILRTGKGDSLDLEPFRREQIFQLAAGHRVSGFLMISTVRRTGFVWWTLLAAYSLYVFSSTGSGTLSTLHLPFVMVIPGYSFASVFLPKLNGLNTMLFSLVGSLSLEIGITSGIRVLGVQGTVSGLSVVALLSAVCFLSRLVSILLQKVRV